ncbi:hypothetical protein HRI_002319400 [Hibiscus trionum]|nr:hypothetical protein HRI_002319400 [Hibiscus trionum]
MTVVYESREKGVEQISSKIECMNIGANELYLYDATDIEDMLVKIQPLSLQALIVDSVQTFYLKEVTKTAVKECTIALLQFVKKTIILVLLRWEARRRLCLSDFLASLKDYTPTIPDELVEHYLSKSDFQSPDVRLYGSWGVCFTYGTWFGVKGLVAAGKSFNNSSSIKKACDFLLSKQLPSGDWGESYLSCQNKVYSNIEGNKPHMVNTGWAMLALIDDGQGAQVSMTSPGFFVYELYAPRELIPFWKS